MPSQLDAVLFDLDDTLIVDEVNVQASFQHAAQLLPGLIAIDDVVTTIRNTARRIAHSGPYADLCNVQAIAASAALWSDFDGCHECLEPLIAWAPHYREEVWVTALANLGIENSALAKTMSDAFIEHRRRGSPLADGAVELVSTLASKYRLGLVTNGPVDAQRRKFERTGFSSYFAAVVISGEVGTAKPSSGIFEAALRRLGATPSTTVMIGDNWRRDIIGARTAGIAAVWLAFGREMPEQRSDVVVVQGLGDITVDLLDKASSSIAQS